MSVLGLDFGGTNLKLAPKLSGNTPDFLKKVPNHDLGKIPAILAGFNGLDITSVGVSCPGDIDYQEGRIKKSLRLGTNIPIASIIREALDNQGLPVFLLNDAQSATLAELHLGGGQKEDGFLFINLGSNPGGGVVLNGHLLLNSNGRNLGRVGHLCLNPNGPRCRCGKNGCWDTYLSAQSLVKAASAFLSQEIPSPKEVQDLADAGDAGVQQIWREYAWWLAQGVVDLTNFLGLQTAVIGGGIALAGKWLFDPLREKVSELSRYPVAVYESQIEKRLASVYGATILAEKGYQGL